MMDGLDTCPRCGALLEVGSGRHVGGKECKMVFDNDYAGAIPIEEIEKVKGRRRYWKVSLKGERWAGCMFDRRYDAAQELRTLAKECPDEVFEIQEIWMRPEEFELLKEFDGDYS